MKIYDALNETILDTIENTTIHARLGRSEAPSISVWLIQIFGVMLISPVQIFINYEAGFGSNCN